MINIFPTTRFSQWRFALLSATLLFILSCTYVPAAWYYFQYIPRQGDFVFQSLPEVELVVAIEGVTGSHYSHVGMVIDKDGSWYVREAIGEVQDTPLYMWILRGRDRAFDAYRLKQEFQVNVAPMVTASLAYLGRPYDFRYQFDDEYIYCSELLYKAYRDATGDHLGQLVALGSLNWEPYAETIEKYEGGPVPRDRLMITPIDLSAASQLEKVFGRYVN